MSAEQAVYSLPDQIKDMEVELIYQALSEANFNKTRAAKLLGIKRTTLVMKVKKYWPNGIAA